MASSGFFDPYQIHYGYKAVEILDPPCSECLIKVTGSRKREVARLTNVGGAITTGVRPIYSSSQAPISRINNQVVVKRIRKISDSPTDPNAEGSDEFDGEEVEVINPLVSQSSRSSPTQRPFKKFHSHIIPSTPENLQPVLSLLPSSISHSSPNLSTARPSLVSPVRP
ncbi:hypothetical protein O181_082674 [Austropuccinia psidii MF-1]|uniref:Uncharacterized protein n=1 Tax=Austropuccinia psidii MF-1 TaxID=1389203 RepID=A0A9Q3FQ50_9BASI|nr:hypothetical protein [Austropuccinia psidii MF-1]